MTMYSVTAGLQPPAMSVASSPVGQLRTTVLSAVAGTLNTSVADVQGRLRAGQSLADLARTAGMSQDELMAAITSAVTASGDVAPDLSVDAVVQRIADQRKKTERTPSHPPRSAGRAPARPTGSEGRLLDVEL
jgi:lambda repressor-like predicted transcriptional regulator